jgi:hypothetical protein
MIATRHMATGPPSNPHTTTPNQHTIRTTTAWRLQLCCVHELLPPWYYTNSEAKLPNAYLLPTPSQQTICTSLPSPPSSIQCLPPPSCLTTLSQQPPPPSLSTVALFQQQPSLPHSLPYRNNNHTPPSSLPPPPRPQSTPQRTSGTVQCPKVDAAYLCAQAHWAAL